MQCLPPLQYAAKDAPMSTEHISISLRSTDRKSVDKAVAQLKRAGLKEVQVLAEIGIVTGAAAPAATARIQSLDCVAALESAGTISLPPDGQPQ